MATCSLCLIHGKGLVEAAQRLLVAAFSTRKYVVARQMRLHVILNHGLIGGIAA